MTARAWAELLRVSALFTVPGDALAGAATTGGRPDRGTALAVGASLCLYEAGMALNDWADRDEDAVDRPHRPIPSGRIAPGAALAAAGALTVAGLGLAGCAGRRPLTAAIALTATVWAYDLRLKHTPAGPAAMAAARGLDLLLGATATGTTRRSPGPTARGAVRGPARGSVRAALGAAAALGAHTYAVTAVSRNEARGGSTATPLAALAAVAALGAATARGQRRARGATAVPESGQRTLAAASRATPTAPGTTPTVPRRLPASPGLPPASRVLPAVLGAAYLRTAAGPLAHAALNPSPPLTQRAVGGGIRAMIPLQAALAARSGAVGTAAAVMGLVPLARTLARKVSPT
ncbi:MULTISPECIES: SCO3242 family prenyltransferase [unclassified Streptomyces]|uniref:SCO3242 family prenyltransferase n=1 Tax=unclassified Streptomyces TaxID=2593676 RepID=UPI0035DDB0E8